MQTLNVLGINLIIAFQSAGDWLIAPMRFFSYLGNEEFFLLVLPLLYWSVDSSLGLRVGFILVTSNLLTNVGKLFFAAPRPYWLNPQVHAWWTTETTFGTPSGHALLAVSVWGIFAAYEKRKWIWVVSSVVIFFVGFSRIYLGVHFPHDVVVGWLFGAVILWAFVRYWEAAGAWLMKKTPSQQMVIAFFVSLVFIAIGFGAAALRSGYQIPEIWMTNSLLAVTDMPNPVNPDFAFTSAGTFFGAAVGAAWIMSIGGYQASGPMKKRALRYVIGLIGIVILWMGLGELFPRNADLISYSLRFVRYSLVGWWVTGGAPWAFVRFNLAERLI